MALLDLDRGRLVIRIVYDGPAFAGKTTSVRSLGQTYGREVFSSESPEGRTLHFDWLEYEGGRFDSYKLCCQVVTVPGQADLAERRRRLLESADAVVFVLDSRRPRLDEGLAVLASLRAQLAERPDPRPGLLIQANWRDAPDATPFAELIEPFGGEQGIGITESIATEDTGTLQTFVLAVRLALDRVAGLVQAGQLIEGAPEVTSGPELLAVLERLEQENPLLAEVTPPIATPTPVVAMSAPPTAPRDTAPIHPPLPSDHLPIGRIWPPVEGRLMLHEARAEGAVPRALPSGEWAAQSGRWYFHSGTHNLYSEEEAARTALLEWARWHSSVGGRLSPRRCLSLVEEGHGHWRLWQTVRAELSLSRVVEKTLASGDVAEIVQALVESARMLEECRTGLAEARLPVTLETVGVVAAKPVYVGVAPSFEYLRRLQEQPPPRMLDFGRLYGPLLERTAFEASPHRAQVLERLLESARTPALEERALNLAAVLTSAA